MVSELSRADFGRTKSKKTLDARKLSLSRFVNSLGEVFAKYEPTMFYTF